MKPKIKTAVFDLGGVLFDWRTPFQTFLNQFNLDLDSVLQTTRDIIVDGELGKITTDELCRKSMRRLGHEAQWPGLRKIMPAGFILYPETLALIKTLFGEYRLAILTNTQADQVEEMDKSWSFKQYFEVIADSSKLGIRKPDAGIFEFVLKRLALMPQDCLFTDDFLENIDAAKALGFQTVRFTDPETSVKEIKRILEIE